MKKNLRNVLALALGLMTTVSFAQDWNVDSRTRIDMSEADKGEGYKSTDQRVTLGATWGGDDWGIHVSSDVNYMLGSGAASMGIYEAYATTDLFGFATMTAGRQAINNGSGALMSSNDWGSSRTTWDGLTFGFNFDVANISAGYASMNTGVDSTTGNATDDIGNMWLNAGGEFSGWNVNLLYMTRTASDDAATGIDVSGELMGAGISASMNKDWKGNEMRVIGLSYAVNDDISVKVGQTAYSGDSAFYMAGTNLAGGWMTTGNLGYLNAGDEDLHYGLSYNMGDITLGATMHSISNTDKEDIDRSVTEVNIGYALSDNASLGVKYVSDDDAKYTWVTLTVTP